ncbi:hypothetical protein K469DRAFT_224579 [Zopfia rhizophila CBS 207.26]|uniref:Uncharacterized protein n=1 Tax=Zopfia rhizophila CBS 207.26 TaxID=1314779 RepID=A0A6A6DSE9_9PEZI|nr:hypothetical protein K469DRAFT_224579 [Zopfia rhizophila CBS 207.26]
MAILSRLRTSYHFVLMPSRLCNGTAWSIRSRTMPAMPSGEQARKLKPNLMAIDCPLEARRFCYLTLKRDLNPISALLLVFTTTCTGPGSANHLPRPDDGFARRCSVWMRASWRRWRHAIIITNFPFASHTIRKPWVSRRAYCRRTTRVWQVG